MFKCVIKRDGREEEFDLKRILNAIMKAVRAVGGNDELLAYKLTLDVCEYLKKEKIKDGKIKENEIILTVNEIHDAVEKILIERGHSKTAKQYITYRYNRDKQRESNFSIMNTIEQIHIKTSRENANIGNTPMSKMLQIGSTINRFYYLRRLIPEKISDAHITGDIHIHDLDFYGLTLTCLQIPLGKLLREGFNTGHGDIRTPKRPMSAAMLTAIIIQSSQNDMHGGQSIPFFSKSLEPYFVNASDDETFQAMEALVYNLNSMHSRAGAQVPFSSINIGDEENDVQKKITRNFLLAFERGLGNGEAAIWPNIIFRVKEGLNYNFEDPNYDLFKLAIKVASKRMNPTFSFMDCSINKKYGTEVAYMGCRTRVIGNRHGPEVTERRGNLSFTTINLPRIAIKSKGFRYKFFNLLEEMCDLVVYQLKLRYDVQKKLKVYDMPFIMGEKLYLDSEKLNFDDEIEPAIKHGSLSVGFIGLAETLRLLTGYHHGEDDDVNKLGLEIVKFMHNKMNEASEKYNLNYVLLATPAEGLSGRFVNIDKNIYSEINGVTDKMYYTNSFHIPVDYNISIFDKIMIEGQYHKFCTGGHITYVETQSPPVYNLEAVETIIKHMKECDVGYGAINFPIDMCLTKDENNKKCCYESIINDVCPKCGGTNIRRIRRITGYLSTLDRFNEAKIAELNDRVIHKYPEDNWNNKFNFNKHSV